MLDIGCGATLRGGRLHRLHLDASHYYGIDISPGHSDRRQEDADRARAPGQAAPPRPSPGTSPWTSLRTTTSTSCTRSVFSSPLNVIEECLSHVGRVLTKPGVLRLHSPTAPRARRVLREDFYYRTDTLLTLAAGPVCTRSSPDWRSGPHGDQDPRRPLAAAVVRRRTAMRGRTARPATGPGRAPVVPQRAGRRAPAAGANGLAGADRRTASAAPPDSGSTSVG